MGLSKRFWWLVTIMLWLLVGLGFLLEGKFFSTTAAMALVLTALNLMGDREERGWTMRLYIPYEVMLLIVFLIGLAGLVLAGLAWFK